jgi:hypothetical protein
LLDDCASFARNSIEFTGPSFFHRWTLGLTKECLGLPRIPDREATPFPRLLSVEALRSTRGGTREACASNGQRTNRPRSKNLGYPPPGCRCRYRLIPSSSVCALPEPTASNSL